MIGLGVLPGGSRCSVANGVSADGSIIVGSSYGESGLEAFVWEAARGMRSVRDLLHDNLVVRTNLTDWKNTIAYAVSAEPVWSLCLLHESTTIDLKEQYCDQNGRRLTRPLQKSPRPE